MKKYIFLNYYSDKNEERKKEYLYCVQKNLEPDFIDKVFIFVENPDSKKDIPFNDKIVFVDVDKRMEYKDVIEYANTNLEKNAVFIIVLLDIFIENSEVWATVDEDFFNVGYPEKALICKRHNLDENMNVWIEEYSWGKGEFWDAMVLKTPVNTNFLKEDLKMCVGNSPQADNTLMFLLSKYYHVFSWGSKYKIFHVDNCRKQQGSGMIFNSTTDYRASKRKNEHLDVPAFQNWEKLLETGTQPKYLPTWRIYMLTINI